MPTLDGLHPTLMRPRVEATLADPDAVALGLFVVSGFRSVAEQTKLWYAALRKYGNEETADNWVARPGTSNHGPKVEGFGIAVDFGVPGVRSADGQWPDHVEHAVNVIASRHGLRSPMEWEDWHFEPIPDWSPAPPPLPLELLMPLFANDDEAAAFLVVLAYSTLLGRGVESLQILAMWMQEAKDHDPAYVWDAITKSDEAVARLAALAN